MLPIDDQCDQSSIFVRREAENSLLQYAWSRSNGQLPEVGSTSAYEFWNRQFLLDGHIVNPRKFLLFTASDVEHATQFVHLGVLVTVCGVFGAMLAWLCRSDPNEIPDPSVRARRTSRLDITESLTMTRNALDSWNVGAGLKKPARATNVVSASFVRSFKLAFKVGLSSCLVAAIGGTLVPLRSFHMSSSGITVLIVMEMVSLDRLLVKGFLRIMGTFIGAFQAVLAIKVVEWANHYAAFVFVALSLVIVPNAMLQVLNPSHGYMYLASNVTFVFTFYGYWFEGPDAISSRVISVVVAVCVAWLVDLIWPLVWLDPVWFSGNHVFKASERLLQKTFAIIDYTFVHDEVLAKDIGSDTPAVELWRDRFFQPESVHFFGMRQEHLKFGDLQKGVKKSGAAKRVANEAELARLYSEASNAWRDIELTYSMICRRPSRNYSLFFERLHAVYVQASSLSHMSFTSLSDEGQAAWRDCQDLIEDLREAFYSLESPLLNLLHVCHEQSGDIDDQVEEVADAMEVVLKSCESAIEAVQNCQKQDRLRLEIYFMTANLIVSELGTYALNLMECFSKESSEKSVQRLSSLSRQSDM